MPSWSSKAQPTDQTIDADGTPKQTTEPYVHWFHSTDAAEDTLAPRDKAQLGGEALQAFVRQYAQQEAQPKNGPAAGQMSRQVYGDGVLVPLPKGSLNQNGPSPWDHKDVIGNMPDASPGTPAEAGAKETAQKIFDRILSRAGLRRSSPRRTDPRETPPESHGWMLEGRDKIRFFADNRAGFENRIAEVNATQRVTHGAGHQPLTIEDVAVVYMAEAGLAADGTVDPGYVHSNGEIGLFPLPGNIAFWIGGNVPAYNRPMPLDVNIRAYLAYLGALKNKTVKTMGGRALYPGLFLEDGIARHTDRAAKLLAGIVHGYFWDGNYAGQPVPLNHILQGYTQDLPLDEIMRHTGYVHAGKSLMKNRQRNIDEAFLRLV